MTSTTLNSTILEPLFAPWAEPNAHRVRAEKTGDSAVIVQGRRASPIDLVSNLRSAVRDWREAFYIGASDTTIQLLNHWFGRAHRQTTASGEDFEFRYYFCQREAIETLIYLKEVRRIECLSQIIAEFGGATAELQALGITEDEDSWSRYAFKLATGAGKTKVMSLCIVWSYFHALRESDSEMARHFVVIAPNLTVYERLKDDFGNGRVFDTDPLIPPEWRGDWNLSVVLQDEASGAATGGTLYLTNVPKLEGLTLQDVKKAFKPYKALPLSKQGNSEIQYEGRHLFTGEVIQKLQLNLPLLESGIGAVSYYVKQLETICKLRGLHAILAPLIQNFLESILFEQKSTLFDPALVARLADSDVGEHLRAVFVPLIRSRTTATETRLAGSAPKSLNTWKPYQVTLSERRPALEANKTLFNLVSCNRELEVAVAKFCDRAPDVTAFAKNAGSQCLRVDYLANGDRLAFYTPDFFIRTIDNHYYLVETKGREDRDVPLKAKAAIAWCEAASTETLQWQYLYIPQGVFERMAGDTVAELARACAPALQNLLQAEEFQDLPLFVNLGQADDDATAIDSLIDPAILNALPSRYRRAADQAVMLYRF